MKLNTRVFELCNGKYRNLVELAKTMEISQGQIYRVRNGFVVLSWGIDKKQRLRYHLVKSDYGDDGVVVVAKRMAKVLL